MDTPALASSLQRVPHSRIRELADVAMSPAQVLVTASGVQALNVAIRCVIDPAMDRIARFLKQGG